MKKYIKQILLTFLTALAIGLSVLLTACNVTRHPSPSFCYFLRIIQ